MSSALQFYAKSTRVLVIGWPLSLGFGLGGCLLLVHGVGKLCLIHHHRASVANPPTPHQIGKHPPARQHGQKFGRPERGARRTVACTVEGKGGRAMRGFSARGGGPRTQALAGPSSEVRGGWRVLFRLYAAAMLALFCCYPAVILLLSCCYPSVILLLSCCYPAAILLLSCCYPAAILLLSWLSSSFILLCHALCGASFRA